MVIIFARHVICCLLNYSITPDNWALFVSLSTKKSHHRSHAVYNKSVTCPPNYNEYRLTLHLHTTHLFPPISCIKRYPNSSSTNQIQSNPIHFCSTNVSISSSSSSSSSHMNHQSPSSSSSSLSFHPQNQTLTLIPGLPYDLAALILAFLPYSHHNKLKSICKSWKHFFSSRFLHSIRHKHIPISKISHLLCIFPQDPSVSSPYIFDPQSRAWSNLPLMPCNPHVYGLCNFVTISHNSYVYVLGGSLFDTRSFPLDRPSPSSSVFRYDFVSQTWDSLPPMLSPRGSFACAAVSKSVSNSDNSGSIVVAGGGSRHTMFGAAGSRMSSVEMYDIGRNEWVALDGLPRFRAGCVGFMVGNGDGDGEKEFWVMGGYGESRTILGVFPVDEYYRDAAVMRFKNGGVGKWRGVGDMWEEGERRQLGRIAVVDDAASSQIFMLDKNDILRYDMTSNRWLKETTLPKRALDESAVGFVALNGELHVMASHNGAGSVENRRLRRHKRSTSLYLQIYNPGKKIWRTLITTPPFQQPLDFKTTVMCTIRL
ncbi:hypothetical protein QVD17_03101 [Tagetes erecta]|uniref:F-box domain-containing protein n=1 Tax=Tagetes erecta TaxID=13708 RepID=A0AAD8P320_TARER|nr:hypothetical protein QVD17_03101 [Tagetes erecta]